MNILRPTYMRQLIDAQNNGLIKIVSGIRSVHIAGNVKYNLR